MRGTDASPRPPCGTEGLALRRYIFHALAGEFVDRDFARTKHRLILRLPSQRSDGRKSVASKSRDGLIRVAHPSLRNICQYPVEVLNQRHRLVTAYGSQSESVALSCSQPLHAIRIRVCLQTYRQPPQRTSAFGVARSGTTTHLTKMHE
jgi:hypothetical protein